MAVAPCIVCLRIAPVRRGRFSAHRNSKPNKSCIMKKIFTLLAFAACCAAAAWSCSDEYDDSGLRQEIADIRQEIASMKEQVNSLKTLVDALNGNKFITNYTESDDGWSITFNDGKTITIRDGKKGADAPVLGIARFEGVYYWTLGGADEWLLDDAGSKIPVAGQDGKTPSVDEEGYWTIDGEPVKGADGQPVKAVGEDGDSFFEDVRQTDDEVIFILAGGETIRLPKAKEVNFVIERTTLTLKYGQTEKLAVTQKGVESYSISKPDGWRASLDGDVLSITAPVEGNIYAEKSGKVTVVAVGATATVVAAVEVNLSVFDDNNAGSSDWEEWN